MSEPERLVTAVPSGTAARDETCGEGYGGDATATTAEDGAGAENGGTILAKRRKHKHKHKRRRRKHGEGGENSGREIDSAGPSGPQAAAAPQGPSLLRDRERREENGMAWMTVPRAKAEASEGDPLERDGGGAEKEPKRKVVDLAVAGGTTNDAEKQKQVVGDGGASWRMKALKRAARRADEEGKKLEDVAADRWGSLRDLTGGIVNHTRESGTGGGGHRGSLSSRSSNAKLSWRRDKGGGTGGDKNLLVAASKRMNKFTSNGFFLDSFNAKGPRSEHDAEVPRSRDAVGTDFEKHSGGSPSLDEKSGAPGNGGVREDPPSQRPLGMGMGAGGPGGASGQNMSAADLLRARLKSGSKAGGGVGSSPTIPRSGVVSGRTSNARPKVKEVILPTVSLTGGLIGGSHARGRPDDQARGHAPGHPFTSHDEDGKRTSYFVDDNVDLSTLVREQRFGGGRDVDELIGSHISKRKAFRQEDIGVDEEYDNGGALSVIGKTSDRKKRKKTGQNVDPSLAERQKQIAAFQRAERAQEHCQYCLSNPRRPKHLVVAIGQMSYLRMPSPKRSITDGHCLIVPMEHIPSTRVADDNTLVDVRNFKKSLIRMFAAEGKSAVFMEVGAKRGHVTIEAVPVPADVLASLPLYFKTSFSQMSDELNGEHRKHLIETGPRGLEDKIPPGFPYFFVEFNLGKGWLSVGDFPKDFGLDILKSLLTPPSRANSVQAFSEKFARYDWTLMLVNA